MHRWERIAETVHTRTARPSINLTGLAHSLGISRPALTRRLNGTVAWRYDELEILAKQFDLTVEQLAGEQNSDPEGIPSGSFQRPRPRHDYHVHVAGENHVNDTTVGDAS